MTSAIDQIYVDAGKLMFAELALTGTEAFRPGTRDLTHEAIEVFGRYFHPMVEAMDRARSIPATVAPVVVRPPRPRRRRAFPDRVLARYPLTQPAWRCQRCEVEVDYAQRLELDHMMELAAGGPDHPYNLIRLCSTCHRRKPFVDHLASFAEWRLAIITWARTRSRVDWD